MNKPVKLPRRITRIPADGSVPVARLWTSLVLLVIAIGPPCLAGLLFSIELWPWVFLIPVFLFSAAMGALAWQGWGFVRQLVLLGKLSEDAETDDVEDLHTYDLAQGQARRAYRPARALWLLILPPLIVVFGGTAASILMWLGEGWPNDMPFSTILLHPLWHLAGGVWLGAVLFAGARLDLLARAP